MSVTIGGTTGVTFSDASVQNTAATGFGFKNRIINGAMGIAQRGTTYALTTALAYGSLDRFFAGQNGTANGRFAQVAYNANGFQYIALVGRNGSATTTGVIYAGQTIESNNVIDLAGNNVTFSFYAYAGANFSASGNLISVYVCSGTGTDQGASSMVAGTWTGATTIVSTTQAITTTLTRYTFTAAVPSGCKELGVYIAYTPTGTAGADDNVYFTGVQLEKGSTATSFDYRPYGTELALCQRYYWKGTIIGQNFHSPSNGSIMSWPVCFPVTMRATPTASSSLTNISYSGCGGASWGQLDGNSGRFILSATQATNNAYFIFGSGDFIASSAEL